MSETMLEQVKQLATQLPRAERVRLAEWLETTLDDGVGAESGTSVRSLYGLLADLGPGPTDAEIDEARREMWGTFPREDIA
jgi:hypothetical protein